MLISRTVAGPAPLLSIVVATYNRLAVLPDALSGVLRQIRDAAVEVIVVDDCSSDATWEWLTSTYAESPHVRCLRMQRNSGPGPARNMALSVATGRYLLPFDSDFILIDGALARISRALEEDDGSHHLLFFRCIEYPGGAVLDRFSGPGEITREGLLCDPVGELAPVVSLDYMRDRGLRYPALRAGGEGILWTQILSHSTARFLDTPVIQYRTDVEGRICTAEYQFAHAADLAAINDAYLPLFADAQSPRMRRERARRLLASGAYHILAGHRRAGARRLLKAAAAGSVLAPAPLIVSLFGRRALRAAFYWHRGRAAGAAIGATGGE